MPRSNTVSRLPAQFPPSYPLSTQLLLTRNFPPKDELKLASFSRLQLTELSKVYGLLQGSGDHYAVLHGSNTNLKCLRCHGHLKINIATGVLFGKAISSEPCTCPKSTAVAGPGDRALSLNLLIRILLLHFFAIGVAVVSFRRTPPPGFSHHESTPKTPRKRPKRKSPSPNESPKTTTKLVYFGLPDGRWFSCEVQTDEATKVWSYSDPPRQRKEILSRARSLKPIIQVDMDDDEQDDCQICLVSPAKVYLCCPEAKKSGLTHSKMCLPCLQRSTMESELLERRKCWDFMWICRKAETPCIECRTGASRYALIGCDSKQSMPLPFPRFFAGKIPIYRMEELEDKARALDTIIVHFWQDMSFCAEELEEAKGQLDSLGDGQGHPATEVARIRAHHDLMEDQFKRFKLPAWANVSNEGYDSSQPFPFQGRSWPPHNLVHDREAVREHLKSFDLGVNPRNPEPLDHATDQFCLIDPSNGPVAQWIKACEDGTMILQNKIGQAIDDAFRFVQLNRLLHTSTGPKRTWIEKKFDQGYTIAWIRHHIHDFENENVGTIHGGDDDDDDVEVVDGLGGDDDDDVEVVDGPSGDGDDDDYVPSGTSEDADESSEVSLRDL